MALLRLLTRVETFERCLHRTFPGKTRFSVEGLDMLVPMLDEITGCAGADGVPALLPGMALGGANVGPIDGERRTAIEPAARACMGRRTRLSG